MGRYERMNGVMKIRRKGMNSAVNSISRLVDMQYDPANGELNDIHQRLMKGRKEFEQDRKSVV